MSYTQQDQAREGATQRLKNAATFAELHATRRPLLSKLYGIGKGKVEIRFTWPGVLSVHDPLTGQTLVVSEPGRPDCPALWK